MASVISPTASPRRLLLALELFHLSSPRSLSLLQLGDPFRLLWACLAWDGLPSSICNQFVQSPKGRVYILRLLARVVGLDDKLRRLGSVIARGQDVWAEQWRQERQDGGGGDADGSFGGDFVHILTAWPARATETDITDATGDGVWIKLSEPFPGRVELLLSGISASLAAGCIPPPPLRRRGCSGGA